MTMYRATGNLEGLVRELQKQPHETEWVEYKVNDSNPVVIGQYISALSNAAALHGKAFAWIVWGIDDREHGVVGTKFEPSVAKKGNELLETWLLRLLRPRIDFRFHEILINERRVVLLEIDRATQQPVAFQGEEFIRVSSAKKKLKEFPEKEKLLWRQFDRVRFEKGIAGEQVGEEEVLRRLDYISYFTLLGSRIPQKTNIIMDAMQHDKLISPCDSGGFNITNTDAILFANRLKDFPNLHRKSIRIIQYKGRGRTSAIREVAIEKGYASSFEDIIDRVEDFVPAQEIFEQALRRSLLALPRIAIRELVANSLIHQDFLVTGAGPMVEIFENRLEVTNTGEPLVDIGRFLNLPPESRNEVIASLMRRFGICEERGTGIDKVVEQAEKYQLSAPLFINPKGSTRAVLFMYKSIEEMEREERIRACYLHACLKYEMNDYLTNRSLRTRLGIKEKNKATVSRYIREAIEADMIRIYDRNTSRRYMKYVPAWA